MGIWNIKYSKGISKYDIDIYKIEHKGNDGEIETNNLKS